jgi:hypothetical protein
MKHQTPLPLVTILRAIEEQTAKLTEAAAKLDATRHFTLDGRLVGDIGEMLAAQYLELTLDETQRRGHDGFTTIAGQQREVQVKCRKASTLIGFSSVPDLLVVIAFSEDWTEWEIVFNGEGTPIRERALAAEFEVDSEDRIRKGNRRASLDLSLSWFRSADLDSFRAASVQLRSEPLQIFTNP